MSIISTFAQHKVAANLLMVLMIISGLFALNKLNIQFFPNFELDIISVRVVWNGASAEDIETAITIPLEQLLKSVDNLHKMSATSAQNMASIQLEFRPSTDMTVALNKVRQKVDEFTNLPKDAEKPVVETLVYYEGIARIQISAEKGSLTLPEMRQLAYRFERELIQLGIDKIEISGLPDEEIVIEIDTATQQRLQMSLEDIAGKILAHSQDQPLGTIAAAESGKELRLLQQRRDINAFADIVIRADNTGVIRLGDVAHIRRQFRENSLTRSVRGKNVVELSLKRSKNGHSLGAAKILNQWLQRTRETLPPTVNIQIYDESWQLIKDRIRLLLINGGTGLLLVVLILYIFLNARVAFWVAVGIPVSFMATLAILYYAGGTINMISLFALIMALGIIVDDAIVVGEDALAHFQQGENALLAAEGGAKRMFIPVFSSSLTTIAAFLPLMMIGGIMGNILFDIPLIIICVIIASLIESFLVLPGHLRHAFSHLKPEPERQNSLRSRFDRAFMQFRQRYFKSMIAWAIQNRGISLSLAISLLLVCFGLLAGGRIGYSFFPSPESNIIYANVSFVSGTPRTKADAFLTHLEQTLYQVEQELGKGLIETAIVIHGSSFSGGRTSKRGDQLGAIYLQLQDPDKRSVRNETFIRKWHERIKIPAGLESLSISSRKTGPKGSDITIRLSGDNNDRLKQAANELSNHLQQIKGVYSVETDMPYGKEQLVLRLKPQGLALGLDADMLARQLRIAFAGRRVQIFQQTVEEVGVRVRLASKERDFPGLLQNIFVRINQGPQQGKFVRLSSIADWYFEQGFEVIRHANGQLAIEVLAEVDEQVNKVSQILPQLQQDILKQLAQKYHLSFSFEGRAADEKETRADMKYGVVIGLVLIYIVLAWVFQSYVWPLIVMSIIPFGLVGAIVGHWLMDIDMTLLSLFGFFGLSGIVVNDSIILVSFYKHLREQNLAIDEALIQASVLRLRAVLLTSLTTIAGLTPLLFETSLQAQFLIPMATSIAFGLLFATFIVLFLVPVLLYYYETYYESFVQGRWQKNR